MLVRSPLRLGATALISLTLLAGCGGSGKSHSNRAGATTAGATSGASNGAGLRGVNFGQVSGAVDTDGDGLYDMVEAGLGTDPRNPDTDGDGILDGKDLAPLYGAASYGPFETSYPAGAVEIKQDYKAAGMSGRSKVEKWLAGYRTTYEGNKATRSSQIEAGAVEQEIRSRAAQSDFEVRGAVARGAASRLDQHVYQRTFFPSRYTITYEFPAQDYEVAFRNKVAVTLPDRQNKPLASRVIPVKVGAGQTSIVILQFSVDAAADRFKDQAGDYVSPACSFQVYDGTDLPAAKLVMDDVATGATLNKHAFEVRFTLPKLAGTQGTRDWSLVVTPVWVSRRGTGPVDVSAIDAGHLKIGAVAHDQTVGRSQDSSQRLVGIFPDLAGMTTDLMAEAAQVRFGDPVVQQKTVIQKQTGPNGVEFTLSLVQTTAAMAKSAVMTLVRVQDYTSFTSGAELLKLVSADEARRYAAILEQLQRVENASLAVIHGMQAVVSFQQGDVIRATLYAARSLTDAFLVLGNTELVRVSAAGVALATDLYEAVTAFRGNDNLRGAMFVARAGVDLLQAVGKNSWANAANAGLGAATYGIAAYQAFQQGDEALALVNVARGTGSLARFFFADSSIAGIPAGSVITAALGIIDAGYNIHRATKEQDPIRKQMYVEDAVAAVLDTAIMLIPTVGPALEAVWQVGYTVLTLIFPELAKYRMLRSPGALLTFVGTAIFTNEIPSAYAEEAYEQAQKKLIGILDGLQQQGQPVVLVLPKV